MNGTVFKRTMSLLYMMTPASVLYANCTGIIDISNSPSHSDSPCSVPFKKVVVELSYSQQQLMQHAGTQQSFPYAELRIGLPSSNEFFVLLPNYIQQAIAPTSGSTATSAGLKHTISYNDQWIFAVESIANTASGSSSYGAQHWGATVIGIASYTINPQFNISAMLGLSRTSEATILGGRYFNSINPDLIITYTPNAKMAVYGEVYGQSNIDATTGAGFNFDAGLQLLMSSNILFNLSAGQQLYNYLGDFTHYINVGVTVML